MPEPIPQNSEGNDQVNPPKRSPVEKLLIWGRDTLPLNERYLEERVDPVYNTELVEHCSILLSQGYSETELLRFDHILGKQNIERAAHIFEVKARILGAYASLALQIEDLISEVLSKGVIKSEMESILNLIGYGAGIAYDVYHDEKIGSSTHGDSEYNKQLLTNNSPSAELILADVNHLLIAQNHTANPRFEAAYWLLTRGYTKAKISKFNWKLDQANIERADFILRKQSDLLDLILGINQDIKEIIHSEEMQNTPAADIKKILKIIEDDDLISGAIHAYLPDFSRMLNGLPTK